VERGHKGLEEPLFFIKSSLDDSPPQQISLQIKQLTSSGVLPAIQDAETREKAGKDLPENYIPLLMGQVAGAINDIKSAEEIVNEMVTGAIAVLKSQTNLVSRL